MERYTKLLEQFEKIKTAYVSDTSIVKSKKYDDIINNVQTNLQSLNTAIEKNDGKKIVELSAQIRIIMDGFKLLLREKRKSR